MLDIYKAYYTKSNRITDFMVNRINLNDGDQVLEPCGGDGDFIDSILKENKNINIDTVDINEQSVDNMLKKYQDYNNINIRKADTLTDKTFDKYSKNGYYDKIIGNPPYGGWQDYEKRDFLKKKYQGFYVKETYTLFLLRSLNMLKSNGVLSFIIPDTFLYLHNHKALRKHIIDNYSIKEILLFPSKLFPGVSFGYSKLCIITIENSTNKNNNIKIFKDISDKNEFQQIADNNLSDDLGLITIKQRDIKNNNNYSFYLDQKISSIMDKANLLLGDIADCVTGIYTGDNKNFLFKDDEHVKRAKGYDVVQHDLVDYECRTVSGAKSPKRYVPIMKGNSEDSYIRKKIDWYIDWSVDAIDIYNTNKKARFQNSDYYFCRGIAVPMVKSSRLKATIMENVVFDQSIVGIFPKDDKYYYYLLGLLNSDITRRLLFNINPTANNSANYVKRIPIVMPSYKVLEDIDLKVKSLVENPLNEKAQEDLDSIFESLYEISTDDNLSI